MWRLPCCHLLSHWKHFSGCFIPLVKSRIIDVWGSRACLWLHWRSLYNSWHGRFGVPTWARDFLYVILNDILLWSMQFDVSIFLKAILRCFTLWFLLIDDINTTIYNRKILLFFCVTAIYWRISATCYFTVDIVTSLIWLSRILTTTLLLLCTPNSCCWRFWTWWLHDYTHAIIQWIREAVN